jgi:hypothetical protein
MDTQVPFSEAPVMPPSARYKFSRPTSRCFMTCTKSR